MENLLIEKVFVDKEVSKYPYTLEILSKLEDIPKVYIESPSLLIKSLAMEKDSITKSKKRLFLTQNKERFLKDCPGTKNYICCQYKILNFIVGCPLDCSYCILQSYLSHSLVTINVNIEELFEELDIFLKENQDNFFRIGTGELSDSLALDHIANFSKKAVDFFATKNNAVLELKSKTANIENLKNLNHNQRSIISWSLNTDNIIRKEEKFTSSLEERLKAAQIISQEGYWVSFHFDPLIYYSGAMKEYKEVLDALFDYIDSEKIAWISLGALRFPLELKQIIKERFPESNIIYGELLPGLDGKYRYYKSIRIKMYREIYEYLRKWDPDLPIYLCMESRFIWNKSIKIEEMNDKILGGILNTRVKR